MNKHLSDKQIKAIIDSDARINIAWGAVRSGKSYALEQIRFPEFIQGQKGDKLIIGKTLTSLIRNVLKPMQEMYGVSEVTWSKGNKVANVCGVECEIEGANNDYSYEKIQGMTAGAILVNELTLIPESMFNQALSRLSVKGAKLFATCNPEAPTNYVKQNYLDRADELDLKHWKFNIEENIALDPKYVESLKKEYTGIWYDRYILSKWVAAEGSVYDMFDEETHVVSDNPKPVRYWLSGDYGTATTTVFLLFGQSRDGRIYVLDEFVWDAKKKGRQLTDSEQADKLEDFIGGVKHEGFYCDPSAVSFMLTCSKRGIRTIPANNDVLDGIRNVSTLLANDLLYIHENCEYLISDIHSYVWDDKQQEKGEDKPLKQQDHGADGFRYGVRSTKGYWKHLIN